MFKSIRTKITLTYIIIILTAMAFTGLYLSNRMENYFISHQEESLINTGYIVADFAVEFLDQPDIGLSHLAYNFSQQYKVRVIILDYNSVVIGDSVIVEGLLDRRLERAEIDEALDDSTGSSVQFSQNLQQWVMQVAVPMKEPNGQIAGAVFLSYSLGDVFTYMGAIRSFLVFATIIAITLAVVLGLIFARNLTEPLKKLTQATEEMAEGNLDQQISIKSSDELGTLSKQFNAMATKIKDSNQKLRDFVANASHELRTPLTTINLMVNSIKEYPEEAAEFIEDIDKENERLIKLVEDLLDLTRLERGQENLKLELVDFNELLTDLLAVAYSRTKRYNLSFSAKIEENLQQVKINPDQVKQVIFNLFDNAIKYSPEGGNIELAVISKEKYIQVSIKDTGKGIPSEDLLNVFERFYRVDKARSRDMGGTGLGLSICQEIVKAHGGDIWVESNLNQGSIFYFTLPVEVSEDVSVALPQEPPKSHSTGVSQGS